jgi:hypothetical protein
MNPQRPLSYFEKLEKHSNQLLFKDLEAPMLNKQKQQIAERDQYYYSVRQRNEELKRQREERHRNFVPKVIRRPKVEI